ncbi:FUSC family protein [Rhizobium ruizarguesonis]
MPSLSQLISVASKYVAWSEGHVFTIVPEQVDVVAGIRTAIGVGLALGLSLVIPEHDLAFTAVAVFWTSLCDPGGPIARRLAFMCWFILQGVIAITLGSFAAHVGPIPGGLALFAIVFGCGLTRTFGASFGPAPAQAGLIAAIAGVIGVSSPRPFGDAVELGGWFLAGAALALIITLFPWPGRSRQADRQAISAVFSRLEEMIRVLRDFDQGKKSGREAWRRIDTVLQRATRIAIERARLNVPGGVSTLFVDVAADFLSVIIAIGHRRQISGKVLEPRLQILVQQLQDVISIIGHSSDARLELEEAVAELKSSKAQLRDKLGVAATSLDNAVTDLERYLNGHAANQIKPSPTASSPILPAVKINALVWRHAVRVSVAVLASYCLGLYYGIAFFYWSSIATLVIMQPLLENTWLRVVERALGSVIGGLIAAASIQFAGGLTGQAIIITFLSALVIALRLVNYGLFILFLTPMFMLLSDCIHPSDGLVLDRVINECLGACLAIAASVLLWPERQRDSMPALVVDAIKRNMAFAQVAAGPVSREATNIGELQRQAGLANARLETAGDRSWLAGNLRDPKLQAIRELAVALRALCSTSASYSPRAISKADVSQSERLSQAAVYLERLLNNPPLESTSLELVPADELDLAVQGVVEAVSRYRAISG